MTKAASQSVHCRLRLSQGFALFLIFHSSAWAGQYIGRFNPVIQGDLVLLEPVDATTVVSGPGCKDPLHLLLSENVSSPGFRGQFAFVISAWKAGAQLQITGNGTCGKLGNETVSVMKFVPLEPKSNNI